MPDPEASAEHDVHRAPPRPPRSRLRRAARLAAMGLGALLAIALVTVAVVIHRAADLVRARALVAADRVSQRIGRAITLGPARVDLGAELSVQIDDVRVAAAPGQT